MPGIFKKAQNSTRSCRPCEKKTEGWYAKWELNFLAGNGGWNNKMPSPAKQKTQAFFLFSDKCPGDEVTKTIHCLLSNKALVTDEN